MTMLPRKYLQGISIRTLDDMPGIFFTEDYRDRGSTRVLCSYADGKRHKKALFDMMNNLGQTERRRQWDLHHVVEGQHFADIDFQGRLDQMYKAELPCVLIHKDEHVAYNQTLHIKETDEMYRDMNQLPEDMQQRSEAAAEAARDPGQHAQLRKNVNQLALLYQRTYQGDAVLQRIAQNVFNDALQQL